MGYMLTQVLYRESKLSFHSEHKDVFARICYLFTTAFYAFE